MASDIEKLAENLRALAAHAGGIGQDIHQVARAGGRLADVAHRQGSSGLRVGPLVGQLQSAARRAGAAAAAMEQVAVHGDSFADHLVSSRGLAQTPRFNPGAFVAAVGTIVNTATTTLPPVSDTDISCDIGTHEVSQAASAVDRAQTESDQWDAANQLAGRHGRGLGGKGAK